MGTTDDGAGRDPIRSPRLPLEVARSRAADLARHSQNQRKEAEKATAAANKARTAAENAVGAFALAIWKLFRDRAFWELDALPMDEDALSSWADRYHVNVPGLIEHFAVFSNGGFREAQSEGWEYSLDNPRGRASSTPQLLDHAEWLVRFQLGQSSQRIASSVGRQRQAVDDAIKRLVRRIGLELRPRKKSP